MHISALFYTRRFDFPNRYGRPTKELMVASVPRSGSTAFCLGLWRSGLLGAPLEYANLGLIRRQLRWKKMLRHELQYWRFLQRVRTGPNGVFSYKFFVQEYQEIMREKPKLLPQVTPTHVVYFTRQDKVAQAISYSRAERSGAWFASDLEGKPCEYDAVHIQKCLDSILLQEASWEKVFAMTETVPLRLTYEQFNSEPDAVVDSVVAYVTGRSTEARPLVIPPIQIQRDRVSNLWRSRFEREGLADYHCPRDSNTDGNACRDC